VHFHDWTTLASVARELGLPAEQIYAEMYRDARAMDDPVSRAWVTVEPQWIAARKPYYLVYPSIIPALTRLKLDLDCDLVRLPISSLLFRLPKGNALGEPEPRCILAFTAPADEGGTNLGILIDFGERIPGTPYPLYTGRTFNLTPGLTVERSIANITRIVGTNLGLEIQESVIMDCLRLVLTRCLLADDPSIIEPDVLTKDQQRWDAGHDPKLVEKAHRRGKVGWIVGRQIEVLPHYRRPHPCLVWTGPGRTVPKIVLRSGSVVHREIIERMPSGYDEG